MTLTDQFQRIGIGESKSFNGAIGYLELWAKHNGQATANNKTSVTVELRLSVSNGYIGNYQSTLWSISGSLSNSGDIGSGSHRSQTLGSATGDIYHNSDGTKSVSFSGSFSPTAWGSNYNLSVSGSADLPTIPRAPSYTSTSTSEITEHSVRLKAVIDTKNLTITEGGWYVVMDGHTDDVYYSGQPTDKTITGLIPGTKYWYKGYVKTAGGATSSTYQSFTTKDCVIHQKINNSWKKCVPYKKINGTWKKCIPYRKVNGNWKEGIN